MSYKKLSDVYLHIKQSSAKLMSTASNGSCTKAIQYYATFTHFHFSRTDIAYSPWCCYSFDAATGTYGNEVIPKIFKVMLIMVLTDTLWKVSGSHPLNLTEHTVKTLCKETSRFAKGKAEVKIQV